MIALSLAALLLAADPAPPPAAPADAQADVAAREKAKAEGAIAAARSAVEKAGSAAAKREEAAARVKEAEALFAQQKYADAAKAADGAWQLVAAKDTDPTHFAIDVKADGKTTVTARSGTPVRVEAGGTSQRVYPGQEVQVERGHPPTLVSTSSNAATGGNGAEGDKPGVPHPTAPANGAKFIPRGAAGLAWDALASARGYEVDLVGPDGKKVTRKLTSTRAPLAGMKPGKYSWCVRAVNDRGVSESSAVMSFELLPDPDMKLNVNQNTTWK